ncbi:MAG: beta-ketoacyl-[acyl-carrier-protein] synthase family protein [Rhizobacter sp.]
MIRPEPIAVVGIGVKTPAGLTSDALWAALCAGRSTAQPYADARLPPDAAVLVSRADGFEPRAYLSAMESRRLDRAHQLAIGAAQDAIDACGAARPPAERCAVVCGVGLGAAAFQEAQYARLFEAGAHAISPLSIPTMMPSAMAALLSLRFGFKGPCLTVSTACASGATAIAEGVELVRRGAADLVLAGGADSLVTYSALAGFLRLDVMSRQVGAPDRASRPFDVERDGFVIGEGAGFVVLQRAGDARASGLRIDGWVLGQASGADAHNLVAPCDSGEGALACMREALRDAGVSAAELSHVNAHGTSTIQGDLAEARALTTLFGGRGPPVTAVKGTTGHLIAGSGAVEAIVTLRSLEAGIAPPIAGLRRRDPKIDIDVVRDEARPLRPGPALSNSFGFGGMNTALVLAAA